MRGDRRLEVLLVMCLDPGSFVVSIRARDNRRIVVHLLEVTSVEMTGAMLKTPSRTLRLDVLPRMSA